MAVPAATAATTRLEPTVAKAVLLDFHVTALFEAVVGNTTAISVLVSPTFNANVLFVSPNPSTRFTPVTATVVVVTVTTHVATLPPSAVVTVIVAVPAPPAATTPLELTVATAVLLEFVVTASF